MERSHSVIRKQVNVLLLGETGVGKSTWINSFANYIAFETLEEAENGEMQVVIPTAFTITDDNYQERTITTGFDGNEIMSAGESTTQKPRTYCFNYKEYIVRIIDTPGIGDSRGPQQDKLNFQMIMDHLSRYKEVNAICILLKPNNARLTILFEHLLTHLHKDAIGNLVFCFTSARNTFYRPGNTLPLLRKLLENFQDLEIPLDKSTIYCVDNESVQYLAAQREGLNFDDQRGVYVQSWETSSKEIHRLLEQFISIQPHLLQNTVTLNEARRIALDLTKPLADIGNNIKRNIQEINRKKQEVENVKGNRELITQNLFIPVITFTYSQLSKPFRVCNNPKCCNEVTLENGETGKQHSCKKVKSSGVSFLKGLFSSKQCSQCGCPKRLHDDIFYEIREGLKQEKFELVENNAKLLDQSIENVQKQFLDLLLERIAQLENEQKLVFETQSKFASFLKKNAIAPYNDVMIQYLDQKIENVKLSDNKNGTELFKLARMKSSYLQEVQTLEYLMEIGSINEIQSYEIQLLMNKLKDSTFSGTTIRDILEKQSAKGISLNEKVVDVRKFKKKSLLNSRNVVSSSTNSFLKTEEPTAAMHLFKMNRELPNKKTDAMQIKGILQDPFPKSRNEVVTKHTGEVNRKPTEIHTDQLPSTVAQPSNIQKKPPPPTKYVPLLTANKSYPNTQHSKLLVSNNHSPTSTINVKIPPPPPPKTLPVFEQNVPHPKEFDISHSKLLDEIRSGCTLRRTETPSSESNHSPQQTSRNHQIPSIDDGDPNFSVYFGANCKVLHGEINGKHIPFQIEFCTKIQDQAKPGMDDQINVAISKDHNGCNEAVHMAYLEYKSTEARIISQIESRTGIIKSMKDMFCSRVKKVHEQVQDYPNVTLQCIESALRELLNLEQKFPK